MTFLGTPKVTHGAIKGLISFMQCSDTNFHGIYWRAVIIANVTCFYVPWTNFIWTFKLPFWENSSLQISHLKDFTFSWADWMCPIKWSFLRIVCFVRLNFVEKLWWQVIHWNNFLLSGLVNILRSWGFFVICCSNFRHFLLDWFLWFNQRFLIHKGLSEYALFWYQGFDVMILAARQFEQ